jgi:glutamine cyclotransferase
LECDTRNTAPNQSGKWPGDEDICAGHRYSESLSWWGNVLWNVSYSDNGIYSGNLASNGFKFERKGQTSEVHAWGLTHDDKHLITTGDHGSNKLYSYSKPQDIEIGAHVDR